MGSPQLNAGLPKVNCKLNRGEPRVHRGSELSGGGLWLARGQTSAVGYLIVLDTYYLTKTKDGMGQDLELM